MEKVRESATAGPPNPRSEEQRGLPSQGTPWDLSPLLEPKSVALVGASERPGHAATAHRNLTTGGFPGRLYLVNPNREVVFGTRCFPSVTELHEPVDLAIIVVRTELVLSVLEECFEAGARSAIIVSEGFAETGRPEAIEMQAAITRLSREWNAPVCGPNCLGLVNTRGRVWACSAPVVAAALQPGGVGIVSQSGGNCLNFVNGLYRRNMFPAFVISSGNEASVDAADYIDHLLDLDEVHVIGAYIEQFKDPSKFRRTAERALEAGKPLIVIKVGKSEKGAQSALAHTGALTGSAESYSALFRQTGVLEATEIDGLLDAAALFDQLEPRGWPRGSRIGAIVEGGGGASMLCDLVAAGDLELPDLSKAAVTRLRSVSPPTMALKNPVDLIGAYVLRHPEMIGSFVREFTTSSAYDLALYVVSFADNIPRALDQIAAVPRESTKPLILSSVSLEDPVRDEIRARARAIGAPIILGLSACLTAIKAARRYVGFREGWLASRRRKADRGLRAAPVARVALRRTGGMLDEATTENLLRSWGIPVVQALDAASEEESIAAAKRLGYPVVMKGAKAGLAHKTEHGLTRLDLRSDEEVRRAYRDITSTLRRLPDVKEPGVVALQPLVSGGTEIFVGGSNRDPIGSVVALGLGGITVELTRDVALGIAPLTEFDVQEMVGTLRHRDLLFGFRGSPRADVDALTGIVLAVGDLLVAYREDVLEVDLNPLIVLEAGAVVVDSLITTSGSRPT